MERQTGTLEIDVFGSHLEIDFEDSLDPRFCPGERSSV